MILSSSWNELLRYSTDKFVMAIWSTQQVQSEKEVYSLLSFIIF